MRVTCNVRLKYRGILVLTIPLLQLLMVHAAKASDKSIARYLRTCPSNKDSTQPEI